MTTELESLFADWLQAECSVISEYSGDFTTDFRELRIKARLRAEVLGITYDEGLIPAYYGMTGE